jgi:hypothetical protein
MFSLFVWLVADGWCWFVLREKYCWLVADGWFVLREKYCWLVADKPSEQAGCRRRRRAWRQASAPPRGRVDYKVVVLVLADQDEAVAMVLDDDGRRVRIPGVLAVLDEDVRVRRGAGEELRHVQAVEIDEDASEVAREEAELLAQRGVGVDGGAPRLAHAPGRGDTARREAAEHVREHVLRQQLRRDLRHGVLLAAFSLLPGGI